MGEAKRRKQILGENYGKIPSVLIEGTPQWKKHILKFYNAWQDKWKELLQIGQEKDKESKESSKQQDFSQISEELPKWLTEYLKDYRTKDQEQLVTVLLDEHYEELSELLIEVQEINNLEKGQELFNWLRVLLAKCNCLEALNYMKLHRFKLK